MVLYATFFVFIILVISKIIFINMKTNMLPLFISLLLFTSCEESNSVEEEDNSSSNCNSEVLVSASEYASSESDDFTINSIEINGDCVEVNYSASGCDGSTWKTRFIDSEQILESFPIQRNLVFELTDNEECEAFITKTVSFDVSELKVEDEEVILNITNTQSSVRYID